MIEKLKSEDENFNENASYQDVIVGLYNQKQDALKSLNEFAYYINQMQTTNEHPTKTSSKSPIDSMKVIIRIKFSFKINRFIK